MSKIIARAFAQSIFTNLAAAYGGHSQVAAKAYGEAAVGQINNNIHWHSGASRADVLETYNRIIDEVLILVDDHWQDWEGCEALCSQIRKDARKPIKKFLARNF